MKKPISTLSPFDKKIENSVAYNKMLESFSPETTMRNMMFDVRNKFLKYLQNKNVLKQERSEESKNGVRPA